MLYARISESIVAEIIQPLLDSDGNELDIKERFTSEFVALCVNITGVNPEPSERWLYDSRSGTFTKPE